MKYDKTENRIMPEVKGKYTPSAKLEALAILQHNNNNYHQTMKDTGIPKGTLHKWVKDGGHHAIQEDMANEEVAVLKNGENVDEIHVTAEDLLNANKKHINFRQSYSTIIERRNCINYQTNIKILVCRFRLGKNLSSSNITTRASQTEE